MASESNPSQYMAKVPELRKKFLDKHYSSEKNFYDKRDISRVKTDDQFVLQFLNGRDGNVDKAHKSMMEGLKWRNSFGANDLTEKDIHEDVLKSGALYMHGKDKKGASIMLNLVRKYTWKGDKEKMQAWQKLIVLLFEKHQREHPGEKVTMVSSCEEAGLANMDTDNNKFFANLLSNVYPDLLENSITLEFPKVFVAIWKVFKALIPDRITKKYAFIKKEEIFEYVDKDQLPEEFGGESKFVYKYPPEEKTAGDSNANVTSEIASS